MIKPTDVRIINLMIEKCDKLVEIDCKYSDEEIMSNFIISDSIQFEFEKLYEDCTRLSVELLI